MFHTIIILFFYRFLYLDRCNVWGTLQGLKIHLKIIDMYLTMQRLPLNGQASMTSTLEYSEIFRCQRTPYNWSTYIFKNRAMTLKVNFMN
jgi:hypothetical protein